MVFSRLPSLRKLQATPLLQTSLLKMESVSKNTIFGQKMIVKSGLEQFILKSSMREDGCFNY